MKILVSIKNVYGRETIYPECEKSKAFAAIAGNTTITPNTLELVKALGYSIEIKQRVL